MNDVRQVFDDLVRFETMLWNALDERLTAESGLSLSNLNLMLVIDSTPSCRVLDIAQALAITVGGTSQAVDRIEKAGWCSRKPHPSDRRSSIVELSEVGISLLAEAVPVFDAELERLLVVPLPGADLQQLGHSLGVLRRSASAGVTTTS